jgi:hypothetical protein
MKKRPEAQNSKRTWLIASALAVPISIIIHEFGHLFAAFIVGIEHATIHYSAVHFPENAAFGKPLNQEAQ